MHYTAEFSDRQARYRKGLDDIVFYFESQSEYTIFALSHDNALELNFVSDYRLGYYWNNGAYDPALSERVFFASQEEVMALASCAYIFLRDEHFLEGIPVNWWL